MKIKLTKPVDVCDEQGNVRFTHKKGSIHDWGIAEAARYIEAKCARPADDDAKEHWKKWQALSDEQRAKFSTPDREVGVSDDGRVTESVG